ncbi:hypothetical protein AVEN_256918-1 [Araneus ventricosus]|uniref:Uncharacterized protein n=1 Tax=Araneus ventricosus TaxID=182803 RepID=A0A4Y2CHZ6_ARAVE|nr:hypothetical protein AVEN_256918-1 [Araneus ventricosus]
MCLSLQTSLTQLEEKSGKMPGISVEEYLTADDDLMVFQELPRSLSEITDEMENDVEEDDDDDDIQMHRNLYWHPKKLFNQFSF